MYPFGSYFQINGSFVDNNFGWLGIVCLLTVIFILMKGYDFYKECKKSAMEN